MTEAFEERDVRRQAALRLRISNECKKTVMFLRRGLEIRKPRAAKKDKKSYLACSRATKF